MIDVTRMMWERDRNYEYRASCLTRFPAQRYRGAPQTWKETHIYGVQSALWTYEGKDLQGVLSSRPRNKTRDLLRPKSENACAVIWQLAVNAVVALALGRGQYEESLGTIRQIL